MPVGTTGHFIEVALQREFHLMASLLYGSGLRLAECLRLQIKDIDFVLHGIIVNSGKGMAA